jgi:hypothetical protein
LLILEETTFDADFAVFVERLRSELGPGFDVTYNPL